MIKLRVDLVLADLHPAVAQPSPIGSRSTCKDGQTPASGMASCADRAAGRNNPATHRDLPDLARGKDVLGPPALQRGQLLRTDPDHFGRAPIKGQHAAVSKHPLDCFRLWGVKFVQFVPETLARYASLDRAGLLWREIPEWHEIMNPRIVQSRGHAVRYPRQFGQWQMRELPRQVAYVEIGKPIRLVQVSTYKCQQLRRCHPDQAG
jgi:hypothetical protein